MRNFVLFVLLINLMVFAYQRWIIVPDSSVDPTHMQQTVPALALVARPEDEVPEEDSSSGDVSDDYKCMRIGPLPRETDADAVRRALRQKRATVRQTAEAGRVWVGYWVQTAGHESRQAAEEQRNLLKEKGMSDVYILPENERHRISLGVFRLRDSAEKVMEQASDLGFETRIVERYQPGTNFWLLVRIPADRSLQSGELPSVPGQILRTESISCRPKRSTGADCKSAGSAFAGSNPAPSTI